MERVGVTRRQLLQGGTMGAAALAAGCASNATRVIPSPGTNLTPGGSEAKEYRFEVAEDEVRVAGVPARGMLVNGRMPGPEIRVTEGDRLRVVVGNRLSIPMTIHWHGMLLPNPMDGVPGVTQEPIPAGGMFVYEYDIRQSGTYWYHSHFQVQEQAGLSGPLIIEPKHETLDYDREFVVFVQDWLDYDPWDVVPRIRRRLERGIPLEIGGSVNKLPDGSELDVDVVYAAFPLNGKTAEDPWTCEVKRGDRVRFRIINGSAQSIFRFMIDGHPLQVVAADGQPVEPVEVDSFLVATSERYDVLVDVKESGSFNLRAAAIGQSGGGVGIMHTSDAKPVLSRAAPRWGKRTLDYDDLFAPVPTPLPEGPVKKFRLELGGNMKKYLWTINGQLFPELYSENGKADPLIIAPGDRVQVEMVNPTPMFHPFHLHGHFFRLLSRPEPDPRAPLKDSLSIPPKGSLRLEFFADNPGNWIFHCHFLYHMVSGMARVWEYRV